MLAGAPNTAGAIGQLSPARLRRRSHGRRGSRGADGDRDRSHRAAVPRAADADDAGVPVVSTLDVDPGHTVSNLVLAPVGPNAEVDPYAGGTSGTVSVIADVSGYVLAAPSGAEAGRVVTPAPADLTKTAEGTATGAPRNTRG